MLISAMKYHEPLHLVKAPCCWSMLPRVSKRTSVIWKASAEESERSGSSRSITRPSIRRTRRGSTSHSAATASKMNVFPPPIGPATAAPLIGPDGAQGQSADIGLMGEGAFQIVSGVVIVTGGDIEAGTFLDFGKVQFPGGRPVFRRFAVANIGDKDIRVRPVWSKGKLGFDLVNRGAVGVE